MAPRKKPDAAANAAPRLDGADRGIFCNRTLNLRSIAAIGYDMDYTLVHYNVDEWERRAYEHIQQKLVDQGWPLPDLQFDPTTVVRGRLEHDPRSKLGSGHGRPGLAVGP